MDTADKAYKRWRDNKSRGGTLLSEDVSRHLYENALKTFESITRIVLEEDRKRSLSKIAGVTFDE